MADLERLPYVTVTAESNSRAYSPLRCQAEGRPWPRSPTGAEATSQSQPTDNVPGAKRGRTPSPGPSISAALHLTLAKLPKDPSYGWTIGRCSESCDIVLAEDWNADSGVSQQQLGIAWNWKQKSLILHVKSRNGVSVMHSNSDYVRHGKGYQMWLSTSGKTRVSFGENYRLSFEISDVFAEEGPTRDAMWARAFSTCQTIPPMPGSLRLDAGKDTRLNPSILLSQEFRRSKKLGFGHSSDVYVVHDHISGAAYAMKVFRGGFQGGDEAAGKIIRKEIKMMSCLNVRLSIYASTSRSCC